MGGRPDFGAVRDPVDGVSAFDPREPGSAALIEPWRALAETRSNPFVTPEWMLAWLRSNPEESACALAWRKQGELRGVLPLVRVARGPVKVLRFAGARRADWVTPACRAEEEAEMASACASFLAAEKGWHALRFDRLAEDSTWPAAIRDAGRRAPAPGRARKRDVLPYIAFDERGYEGYLADRSRNFRSQLGRRRRRLEKDHGLTFRMTAEAEALTTDLDDFLRLHDARWEKRGGSSSADPRSRDHLRNFAAAALERGWLRLWIAEADGAPAAAWYGWRIGERYCYALAGLDEAFEQLALGTVLLAHTIEQAAEEGAAIYDLMWGDEGYKKRFETGRRYADTWLFPRRRHPAGLIAGAGARLAGVAESLPEPLRRPLARAARAVRR
jgi:CelD/BcsL family acetyltransferase involved in cellulose biosynthesis